MTKFKHKNGGVCEVLTIENIAKLRKNSDYKEIIENKEKTKNEEKKESLRKQENVLNIEQK